MDEFSQQFIFLGHAYFKKGQKEWNIATFKNLSLFLSGYKQDIYG